MVKRGTGVKVSLYVPQEIDQFIRDSCVRYITADGKDIKIEKSLNESYLEFIKRGIMSLENEQEKE